MAELIDAAQKVRAAGYQPWVVGGNDWTGSHVIQFMLESRLGYEKAVDMFANGGSPRMPMPAQRSKPSSNCAMQVSLLIMSKV
jgi:hypothetical protein